MRMTITARSSERTRRAVLFDQMFTLRALQFCDRREWQVSVRDGQETDQFDNFELVYVMLVSSSGELVASARLIPTLGPHMLSEIFPDALDGTQVVRSALIWEVSRFVVNTAAMRIYGASGLNRLTEELLLGLFKTARAEGLKHLVAAFDPAMERLLRRAGCRFEEIGRTRSGDGSTLIAGLFEVSAEMIAILRKNLDDGIAGRSVLRFRRERLGVSQTPLHRSAKHVQFAEQGAFAKKELAGHRRENEPHLTASADECDPCPTNGSGGKMTEATESAPADQDCFVTLFDRHRKARRASMVKT